MGVEGQQGVQTGEGQCSGLAGGRGHQHRGHLGVPGGVGAVTGLVTVGDDGQQESRRTQGRDRRQVVVGGSADRGSGEGRAYRVVGVAAIARPGGVRLAKSAHPPSQSHTAATPVRC